STSLSTFTHPPPTTLYTLSLHDALPICPHQWSLRRGGLARPEKWQPLLGQCRYNTDPQQGRCSPGLCQSDPRHDRAETSPGTARSEEHTSELQSLAYLVCRLLLEKKKRQ